MSVKTLKIVHWVFTGIICAMTAMAVVMYITKSEDVTKVLGVLGFPAWLLYHLAFAKASAIVFLLVRKVPRLTEWAYAGLTFIFCLAGSAHAYAGDGEAMAPIMALVILMISYGTKQLIAKKA